MKANRSGGSRLVPRRLFASARRELEQLAKRAMQRIGARSSSRLQGLTRAGRVALGEIGRRWPELAALLGVTVTNSDEAIPPAAPSRSASAEVRAKSLLVLRSGGDLTERARAADSLAPFVDEESTAALVFALHDSAAEVAVHAAEALRLHRLPMVALALRKVVEDDDDYFRPETRAAAVRSLGSVLPRGEGAPLNAAVADLDAAVSLAAIATLAERNEADGADAVLGVIERNDAFFLPMTRHAAAVALSRMQGHDPVRLRSVVDREVDQEVRTLLASLAVAP